MTGQWEEHLLRGLHQELIRGRDFEKPFGILNRTCEEVNEEQSSELSLWILVNIVKVKLTSMIEDGRL